MPPPPITSNFSSLVWPSDTAAFMETVWKKKPFFEQGGTSRLHHLAKILPIEDMTLMTQLSGPNPVEVFFKGTNDNHEQFQAHSVEEALEHYESGKTLYFHIDQNCAAIADWIKQFCVEMGIPNASFRASIFATRQSGGIVPHFDANENFTVQLKGSKTWKIAPNEGLDNPTGNYFVAEPIDETMRSYVHKCSIPDMPSRRKAFDLLPGSVLYLPAGYWHTTQADSHESISLNIVFPLTTWADVFLQSLRPVLLQDKRWRERADDLVNDEINRNRAKPKLGEMISELRDTLQFFPDFFSPSGTADSLPDALSNHEQFIRNPLMTWCVQKEDNEENYAILQFYPPIDPPFSLKVPPLMEEACEWIGNQRQSFRFDQFCNRFRNRETSELERIVLHLIKIRFIKKLMDQSQ